MVDFSFSTLGNITVNEIQNIWHNLKKLLSHPSLFLHSNGKSAAPDQLKQMIAKCIEAKGGEVAARNAAIDLGLSYLDLSEADQKTFFLILADNFDIDRKQLSEKIQTLSEAKTPDDQINGEMAIERSLVSPRRKLFRQFLSLPNGLKFLVDMRADLISLGNSEPRLKKIKTELREVLASFFDIGLLDLKEITWDTSATILEKLIKYEAVHEIQSWHELKNRLRSDRRCFGLFHYKMKDEPLIFVEVALTNTISNNIQEVLRSDHKKIEGGRATTAIFYSISNTQKGLAGISFGNFLIKNVVEYLSNQNSSLKHFATLSPLPGFQKWLHTEIMGDDQGRLANDAMKHKNAPFGAPIDIGRIKSLLANEWYEDEAAREWLKPILLKFAARYLIIEKKDGRAFDPVAHFHLTNGARIERLNWLADISPKGLIQSFAIMVNYYYDLDDIETNHEKYVGDQEIIAARTVRNLLK